MIRRLIGQPVKEEHAQIEQIKKLIDQFCSLLRANFRDGLRENEHIYRIEAWASGFQDSLVELEESRYAANWFGQRVDKPFEEEMNEDERMDYWRHIYFYKNAIIRIFSVLDKMGYFMNEMFVLHTEKVKPRYSYFTVLRQMKENEAFAELNRSLQQVKTTYKDPLNILRKKRNTEIHYVNVEMLDDLKQTRHHFTQKNHIEDLERNLSTLEQGCQMVYQSMEHVFRYCGERIVSNP